MTGSRWQLVGTREAPVNPARLRLLFPGVQAPLR
jgi:hypothetical protein